MRHNPIIGFLLGFALILLILPLRWIIAAIIAALIHELGHYCAVKILGGSIHTFKISPFGAIIEACDLTQTGELISIISGPLAGLLLAFVFRRYPEIALCGVMQSAYNLLPLYPLDGGKALQLIIHMMGGSDRYFRVIECFTIVLLFLLCTYIYTRYRISLFLFLTVFLFRKTPCKPAKDWI